MIPESISETTRWKIVINRKVFDQLKKEKRFWALVALSRAVNALRFVQMPLIEHENDDSPAGVRARYNSLLFSCALFTESELLVQKLHQYFGKLPEFQELSSVTNKSKVAQELLSTGIRDLRNRLVFHFNVDEIGEHLQTLNLSEPIFVSAMGKTNAQVYYELSDLCAARAFSGSLPNGDSAVKMVEERMKKTSDAINDFATTAEKFISAVLRSDGWQGVVCNEE